MSKHTPGTWEVEEKDCHLDIVGYKSGQRAIIASLVEARFSEYPESVALEVDEVYANARLIAAGPELLDALKTVLAKMPFGANWDSEGNNPQWLKDARAAIAKAEGR